MSLHEAVAWHLVQVLFFGTWTVIGGVTVWLILAIRRMPRELIQLRMFREHDRLYRALLYLGAGSTAGLLAPAPAILGIAPPLFWLVAWTTAWCVAVARGMVTLGGLVRMPHTSSLAPSSSPDP